MAETEIQRLNRICGEKAAQYARNCQDFEVIRAYQAASKGTRISKDMYSAGQALLVQNEKLTSQMLQISGVVHFLADKAVSVDDGMTAKGGGGPVWPK